MSGTVRSLKAVYSRSQKSSEQLAATASAALPSSAAPDVYYDSDSSSNDLKALLARSDIDLVLIVLPITIQPQVILAALEAGKHVLSEKPVAADVRRGLDLLETYNSTYKFKGLVWRVAENFEAEPVFQRAAKLVKTEDAIGKISTFKVSSVGYIDETSKYYNTPWRTIPDVRSLYHMITSGANALHDTVSRRFLGELKELVYVYCCAHMSCGISKLDGGVVSFFNSIQFATVHGLTNHLDCSTKWLH